MSRYLIELLEQPFSADCMNPGERPFLARCRNPDDHENSGEIGIMLPVELLGEHTQDGQRLICAHLLEAALAETYASQLGEQNDYDMTRMLVFMYNEFIHGSDGEVTIVPLEGDHHTFAWEDRGNFRDLAVVAESYRKRRDLGRINPRTPDVQPLRPKF